MRKISFPILFLITLSAQAQNMLSLEEAIATALKNNFDIQLSKNDSSVAALNYTYRNAVFLPRINGTMNTAWNNNAQEQKFVDGTERKLNDIKSNNYNAAVQLNWTFLMDLKCLQRGIRQKNLSGLGN